MSMMGCPEINSIFQLFTSVWTFFVLLWLKFFFFNIFVLIFFPHFILGNKLAKILLPVLFFHKSSTHNKVCVYMNCKAIFTAVIISFNLVYYQMEILTKIVTNNNSDYLLCRASGILRLF